MNYWLHRISHEWETSSFLLEQGYLTIGWTCLSESNIENHCTNRDDFSKIIKKYDLLEERSRYNLFNFCNIQKNDIIIVPLYRGKFSVYEAVDKAQSIINLDNSFSFQNIFQKNKEGYLENIETNNKIDLGFFIPVKPLKVNLSRYEYADSKLTARMKMRQANGNITDIKESVQTVLKSDAPINLYATLASKIVTELLDTIKSHLTPDKFEKLIKWYFEKIGASSTEIPAKNESGKTDGADADVVAEFESLKIAFYIQAKFYDGETSDWAVEQISKYAEQKESHYGEFTVIPWVITTANSFSSKAQELAEENDIRLIAGEEFAGMLMDAGINEINKAFE